MRRSARIALVLLAGASLAACATVRPAPEVKAPPSGGRSYTNSAGQKVGKPYQINGAWYAPREQPNYDETGIASWYGPGFHQKATAMGETFDMDAVSAAHTTLPLPSMVEVTNLDNGRKLVVRINDRGPFVNNRIIDLSREAARQLGYERQGIARVRVRYLGPPSLLGREAGVRYASNTPAPPPVAAAPAEPAITFTSTPIRSAAIEVTSLPPPAVATPVVVAAVSPPPANLRIQAGAFSNQANAQRAVTQLALAGEATIEPLLRSDGVTLYRVTLPAPGDEAAAFALRDRVAEIGFADARVVRPF